jgi:hypothetical protein
MPAQAPYDSGRLSQCAPTQQPRGAAMTGETGRLCMKAVVAITSPSYRAPAGLGDRPGAARTQAAGVGSGVSAPPQPSTDEPQPGSEASQVRQPAWPIPLSTDRARGVRRPGDPLAARVRAPRTRLRAAGEPKDEPGRATLNGLLPAPRRSRAPRSLDRHLNPAATIIDSSAASAPARSVRTPVLGDSGRRPFTPRGRLARPRERRRPGAPTAALENARYRGQRCRSAR